MFFYEDVWKYWIAIEHCGMVISFKGKSHFAWIIISFPYERSVQLETHFSFSYKNGKYWVETASGWLSAGESKSMSGRMVQKSKVNERAAIKIWNCRLSQPTKTGQIIKISNLGGVSWFTRCVLAHEVRNYLSWDSVAALYNY